jgi:hypothetical protein
VGGAVLVTGAVTGLIALGDVGSIEEDCPNDVCPFDETEAIDSARSLVTVTDILLVSGTLITAAGLTWALLTMGEDEEVAVAGACGPDGCAASMEVSF